MDKKVEKKVDKVDKKADNQKVDKVDKKADRDFA